VQSVALGGYEGSLVLARRVLQERQKEMQTGEVTRPERARSVVDCVVQQASLEERRVGESRG
jgi:hypothetical protein